MHRERSNKQEDARFAPHRQAHHLSSTESTPSRCSARRSHCSPSQLQGAWMPSALAIWPERVWCRGRRLPHTLRSALPRVTAYACTLVLRTQHKPCNLGHRRTLMQGILDNGSRFPSFSGARVPWYRRMTSYLVPGYRSVPVGTSVVVRGGTRVQMS